MIQRWLQENRKFLGLVAGGALVLLLLQWIFVSGVRADAARKRQEVQSNVRELRDLYKSDGARDPATRRRRDARAERLEEAGKDLDALVARVGAPPKPPFVLPAGEEAKADTHFFTQKERLRVEMQQLAAERAVELRSPTLGIPDQNPGPEHVPGWLRRMSEVRVAVAAAIGSGVEVVRGVQVHAGKERRAKEGRHVLTGTPFTVEVSGGAAACAAWLETVHRDGRFLAVVEAQVKRDPKDGPIVATATCVGIEHRVEETTEAEGR